MDEEMLLNMGPHHPSKHGVLRLVVHSDGEIIRKAVPYVGYCPLRREDRQALHVSAGGAFCQRCGQCGDAGVARS